MARRKRNTNAARNANFAPNDHISAALFDLVPDELQGTDRFLDIINWNIRFFNARDAERLKLITQIMTELNADLIICQEIEQGALDPVAERLIQSGAGLYKTAYGTTGGDQRVAFLYDTEFVKAKEDIVELFKDENLTVGGTRKKVFPRLPLHSTFVGRAARSAFDFHLVGVHLKSQRPSGGDDGTAQRRESAERLARWLTEETGDEGDVIVLGDWNAKPDQPEWEAVQKLERADEVRFLGWNDAREASHFFKNGRGSRLDLVLVSNEAEKAAVDKGANVIHWNGAFSSKQRLAELIEKVSDHMPVLSRFFFMDRAGD